MVVYYTLAHITPSLISVCTSSGSLYDQPPLDRGALNKSNEWIYFCMAAMTHPPPHRTLLSRSPEPRIERGPAGPDSDQNGRVVIIFAIIHQPGLLASESAFTEPDGVLQAAWQIGDRKGVCAPRRLGTAHVCGPLPLVAWQQTSHPVVYYATHDRTQPPSDQGSFTHTLDLEHMHSCAPCARGCGTLRLAVITTEKQNILLRNFEKLNEKKVRPCPANGTECLSLALTAAVGCAQREQQLQLKRSAEEAASPKEERSSKLPRHDAPGPGPDS